MLEQDLRAHLTKEHNKVSNLEEKQENKDSKAQTNKKDLSDCGSEEVAGDEDNDRSTLPPIDYFFKLNGKIILVDTDKKLWHLKKCREYENFCNTYRNSYENADQLFDAFIEFNQKEEDQPQQEVNALSARPEGVNTAPNEETNYTSQPAISNAGVASASFNNVGQNNPKIKIDDQDIVLSEEDSMIKEFRDEEKFDDNDIEEIKSRPKKVKSNQEFEENYDLSESEN